MITRRMFLEASAAGAVGTVLAGWASAEQTQASPRIRLSACDWSLGTAGPQGLEVARQCGLDGLEVAVGGPQDRLAIADPALRQQYKDKMKQTGVVVSSTAMALLNSCPLASDPRGPAWLEQTIEATHDLGARVVLLAFFGSGNLLDGKQLKRADCDAVVERLKAAAPKAKQAGVVLGIENTLSAGQNLDILNRVGSDAVAVYYDVGNSTTAGYDVSAELRELKNRICMVHFKDGSSYLGQGQVKMEQVAEALKEIDYRGWVALETACPSGDRVADFRRNAEYVRKLLGIA